MRAAKKLYSPASFSMAETWPGSVVTSKRGCRLGEEAEERVNHEGWVLFDGCADVLGESCLREGHSNAAVRDIPRGTEQFTLGKKSEQRVQIGFGIEIERRRSSPDLAENNVGEFR